MPASSIATDLWSVAVDKVKFSAKFLDAPTQYTIKLSFNQQTTRATKSTSFALKAASKVPGGPGLLTGNDFRIYKLRTKPQVLSSSMTQPDATGQATVTLVLLVASQIPHESGYNLYDKIVNREFDLSGPPPPPKDISKVTTNTIMAVFVTGGTQLTITFPVKVF